MFNWFKKTPKLVEKQDHDEDAIYKPRERRIYQYWDGKKMVIADPISLYRKVMDKGAEISVDIKVAQSPSKDAGTAYEAMVRKVRTIFDVVPVEQGGLTEVETIKLFDHFMAYCESVKKNSGVSPTPPNPSPTASPSSVGDLPTNSSSASGSTAERSNTVSPTPSPSA